MSRGSLLRSGSLLTAPRRPVRRRVPVCTRTSSYNNGFSAAATATTTVTFRRSHRITVACTDLVLSFGNWANVNGSWTANANAMAVTNSVVLPDGTLMLTYFKGSRSVSIDGGGVVSADSLPVDLPAGAVIQTLTSVTVQTGGKWPLGLGSSGTQSDSTLSSVTNGEGDNSVAATGDVTATPGNTTATNGLFGYSPQAITGLPKTSLTNLRTWVIAGDSFTVGGGDSAQDIGWPVRWLANQYGYFHIGAGNSNASFLLGASGRALLVPIEAGSATDVILAHGTNDRVGSAPIIAAYQGNLIAEAIRFARRDMRVWVPTIAPRTTSVDNFTSVTGQTPVANESNRVAWNAWIRAGLPINPSTLAPVAVGTGGALVAGQLGHPVSGYLELADLVESSRDSGKWKGPDRTVTDAAITSGQTTLTSATAAFTSADYGKQVFVMGAGSAGGNLGSTYIASVTSATAVVLSGGAGTTVSGATAYIGQMTLDGVHPDRGSHIAIATGLPAPSTLPAPELLAA